MTAVGELLDVWREVLRPVEVLSPAEFAEQHRHVVGGPFPGRWKNRNGPYLTDLMNLVREAMETDRNLVCIKGAQMGVTDAIGVNAVMWFLRYFGGPVLYLTAKDDTAKAIVRKRWQHVLKGPKACEPLAKKFLSGKSRGEQLLQKEFADGSLTLAGSQSGLNFISNPYVIVVFDELDSCADHMPDGRDPIATVQERMTALAEGLKVVMIAFAHPTTKEHGAGKIYYTLSDQRRAHVRCPHCNEWWAPLWKDVKVTPKDGQSEDAAKRDPECYELVHEKCGVVISDDDRKAMIRHVEQRTTLEPEVAAKKSWIGVHVWHLFLRKGGNVQRLAKKFIAGLDDPGAKIAFDNLNAGDVHELEEDVNPTEEAWRACTSVARYTGDKAPYYRGELPEGALFLTAGTDQNSTHLHWAIWAHGVLAAANGDRLRCSWLVDWGEIDRDPPEKKLDAADMRPFLDAVYRKTWQRGDRTLRVLAVGHDTGWLPDGVYEFADKLAPIGVSMKGGSDTARSKTPLLRWGKKPEKNVQGVTVDWRDPRLGYTNTYLAKTVFFRLMRSRFPERGPGDETVERWRLHLPVDVDDEALTHLSSERLAREKKTLKWTKIASMPNHLLDCSIEAFVLSEQFAQLQNDRTADEIVNESELAAESETKSTKQPESKPEASRPEKDSDDPERERPRESWRIGRR